MTKDLNLSEKQICVGNIKLGTLHNDLPYYVYPERKVKEFIKIQIDRMNERLSFIDDLRGLAEAQLQRAEIIKIRDDLIKDAGEKLIK